MFTITFYFTIFPGKQMQTTSINKHGRRFYPQNGNVRHKTRFWQQQQKQQQQRIETISKIRFLPTVCHTVRRKMV